MWVVDPQDLSLPVGCVDAVFPVGLEDAGFAGDVIDRKWLINTKVHQSYASSEENSENSDEESELSDQRTESEKARRPLAQCKQSGPIWSTVYSEGGLKPC